MKAINEFAHSINDVPLFLGARFDKAAPKSFAQVFELFLHSRENLVVGARRCGSFVQSSM